MINMICNDITVTLQEIPNEISLTFIIAGCELRCEGCHSGYLWNKNNGIELTDEIFADKLAKYTNTASVVLFMGGEWNSKDLSHKLDMCINAGYKTGLYTGLEISEIESTMPELIDKLNYLKTGRWIQSLGGLDSVNTNQVLINTKTKEKLNKYFIK